jgi:hypothetical protein
MRHVLDKVTWWHFQSTSKKVIWFNIFLKYMHGLKSAFGQFLEWDGCALMVPPSKTHHRI